MTTSNLYCKKCGFIDCMCPGKIIPMTEQQFEDVKQQGHYTQFKIQPATFIAANNLDYFQGNVIKYVMRYKKKNGAEDLKKAKHYIEMMEQLLETGEVKP